MLFFLLINVIMPTIVGILTFMSRKKSCSAELSMKNIISGLIFQKRSRVKFRVNSFNSHLAYVISGLPLTALTENLISDGRISHTSLLQRATQHSLAARGQTHRDASTEATAMPIDA